MTKVKLSHFIRLIVLTGYCLYSAAVNAEVLEGGGWDPNAHTPEQEIQNTDNSLIETETPSPIDTDSGDSDSDTEETVENNQFGTSSLEELSIDIEQEIPEVSSSDAIYPTMNEVGGGWVIWGKWLLISLALSLTITPIVGRIILTPSLSGPILIASNWVGAAHAPKGKALRGGIDGMRSTEVFLLILFLAGPFGVWYCLHHPLMALASESDETFCCVETFLFKESIANKAISPDGRWLAEIRESVNLISKGDFKEKYKISVMDLSTGKYVIWPETNQKYRGVDLNFHLALEDLAIKNGLYAITMKMSGPNEAEQIPLTTNFLKPLNGSLKSAHESEFDFDGVFTDLVVLKNRNGETVEIRPSIKNSFSYLSADGRVLAIVNTAENQEYEGIWRQLLEQQILQWWEIEFWDVNNNRKLKQYSGYGLNSDALTSTIPGQIKFLESSSDGSVWIMIKSDGIVHKFDLKGM